MTTNVPVPLTRQTAVTPRARNWCFTLNNYSDGEVEFLSRVECTYICYGKEVGGLQGTPHLQGFVCFPNAKTRSAVTAIVGPRFHLEIAKTIEEAIAYCKKDGDVYERGVAPKTQAQRGAAGGAAERERWQLALDQARSSGDVEDPQIAFVHARTIAFLHAQDEVKRHHPETNLQNFWYYGDAGTGKSRAARDEYPNAYLKMCNKWWDGYAMEKEVLIEDFDAAHHILGHHLKIWSDRYPFLMEKKGSASKIRPTTIVVTSNWHPSQIWPQKETLLPILRRFTVVKFTGQGVKTVETNEDLGITNFNG